MDHVRLGVSPINWINDDMDDLGDHYDLETVLSDMRDLGFAGTEMGRKYPRDPGLLKALLDKYRLALAGAWKTVQFSSGWRPEEDFTDFRQHVEFLSRLGSRYAVTCDGGGSLHWDARGSRTTVEKYDEAAWQRLAAGLNRVGEHARKHGVEVAYHAHFGTAVETPEEIDRLMSSTDPACVSLLADTGHIHAGGGDPAAVIDRHFERIHYIHLKDVRQSVLDAVRHTGASFTEAVRQGIFTTPGDGSIDFSAIFRVLRRRGYRGWMILEAEQDPAKSDPVVYARRSKEFLGSLLQAGDP